MNTIRDKELIISKMIEWLETVKEKHGDIEITFLDDYSGEFEPVYGGFFYDRKRHPEFQLCTERQLDDF